MPYALFIFYLQFFFMFILITIFSLKILISSFIFEIPDESLLIMKTIAGISSSIEIPDKSLVIMKIIAGISSSFEIPIEPTCYVRQCSLLMFLLSWFSWDQCHVHSFICALWYTTAHLQVPQSLQLMQNYIKTRLTWFTFIILYYNKYSLFWLQ